MKNFDQAWKRICDVTGWKTQSDMAEWLKIKSASVTGAKQRGSFPMEWAFKIAQGFGISTDWLLTGEGPMYRGEAKTVPSQNNLALDEFTLVPRYNVDASCGCGAIVSSEQIVDFLAFRKKWIKEMGLCEKRLALIQAMGDSMEPTIRDGALMLVEMEAVTSPVTGIYIIQIDGELIAKRLHRDLDGGVIARSDNRDYPELRVTKEKIDTLKILGKVVWVGMKI